jgi:hypothetical protein
MQFQSETIDRLLELGKPNEITLGESTFTDKPLTLLTEPEAPTVNVTTLQGIIDLYNANLDQLSEDTAHVLIHIANPTTVEMLSGTADDAGRRHVWARARYGEGIKEFPFGNFLDTETFIVCAQSRIEKQDGDDLEYVLRVASAITADAIQTAEDDGISQRVSMKAGVHLKENEIIQPRVKLAPYRTFPEVKQALAQFVLRARQHGESIELALFEADGGRWRIQAIENLARFFRVVFGDKKISVVA